MKPIIQLCVAALLASTILIDKSKASNGKLYRFKRHTGTLTYPKNQKETRVFQAVVEKWMNRGDAGRAAQRVSELYKAKIGSLDARIDLQDVEEVNKVKFDRLNAQVEDRSFASVHLQKGGEFGVALIRQAFFESEKYGAHVFLSGTEVSKINYPNDNKKYVFKDITRKWNKKMVKTRIWSVDAAVNNLVKRFDKSELK